MRRFFQTHAEPIVWIAAAVASVLLSALYPEHWGQLLSQLLGGAS